jgi:tetratricopeptide (TPR) repeat protein
MRCARLLALAALAAGLSGCAGQPHRARSATAGAGLPAAPATDFAVAAAAGTRAEPGSTVAGARDPRVVDLDIVRIHAEPRGPGGDPELTVVAAAELFREASDAAAAGRHREAIAGFRRLVTELATSRYAPIALFNIAAIYDRQGDFGATVAALRELVAAYPESRESIEGQLYVAALQAERGQWAEALVTLDAALARERLTLADRVEAHARRGYALLELRRYDDADPALRAAIAAWRRAPRIDDPYYIAMAHYYLGELARRRLAEAPARLPDEQLARDLEARRVLAAAAYDHWKESLQHRHAYWATAAGYQMSQIFVELWHATVQAPRPGKLAPADRAEYDAAVRHLIRSYLEKALTGHRMNLELAKAYGVETSWSQGSATRAAQVLELMAAEAATPSSAGTSAAATRGGTSAGGAATTAPAARAKPMFLR